MSRDVLTLYLVQTALLVSILVYLSILRDTIKRSASRSVADRSRCLELATQWNQSLLEQVAALSKQSTALRQALHFYAEPDHWTAPTIHTHSAAATDSGEIARTTLCITHAKSE